MAGLVQPEEVKASEYQGLEVIFEYVNDDGANVWTNCGQAAATTLLTHLGIFPALLDRATAILKGVERLYPPDNFCGLLGTSRRCVTRICKAHGLRLKAFHGEEALRSELALHRPAIVMLAVSAGKLFGFDLPGGHWMVAYGFDSDHIYLTNWGKMSWDEFRQGWNGFVPRLIQMRECWLAIR